MGARHGRAADLDELEFLAEFQARTLLQIYVQVRVGRILVGTGAALGLEVHTVLAREAQLKALGLFAQLGVDRGAHAY